MEDFDIRDGADKSGAKKRLAKIKFVVWAVRRPWTFCLATISIPFLLFVSFTGLMTMGQFALSLDVLLEDRTNYLWKNEAALIQAREAVTEAGGVQPERSREGGLLEIIFEAQGSDNVFTAENIQFMRELEQKFLKDEEYPSLCFAGGSPECLPPFSVLNYFYPEPNDCQVINCTEFGQWNYNGNGTDMRPLEEILPLMATFSGDFEFSTNFVDRSFGEGNLKSKITRVAFILGKPLKGYDNAEDREDDQKKIIWDWISSFGSTLREANAESDTLRLLWFGNGITDAEMGAILLVDLSLTLGSIVMVWLYLLFQLRSFWLSGMAMSQILISFPVALIVYQYIFQYTYIGALNILAIYIVLGIGADDIFIFVDQYNLSIQEPELQGQDFETRMSWVWRRASKAMFVTSCTTFMAFIATAITPLIGVQTFGVFCALLVAVNFLMVISFYLSVIVIYHHSGWEAKWCACCCCCRRKSSKEDTVDATNAKRKFIELFFTDYYTPFLLHKRGVKWVVLAVTLVFIIAGIALTSTTQPEEEALQFLPKGHPLRDVFDLQEEFAQKSDTFTVTVDVIWGLAGIDQTKDANKQDYDKRGTVIWDESFDATAASTQEAILDVCKEAVVRYEKLAVLPNDRVNCYVDDFYKWLAPLRAERNITAERVVGDQFMALLAEFLGVYPYDSWYSSSVGVIDGRIRFVSIFFNTSLPVQDTYTDGEPVLEEWFALLDEMNAKRSEVAPAFPFSWSWSWFQVQKLLFRQAWIGMAVSLLLAFVVLNIFLLNPIVATLAIFTIASIVCIVLGVIKLVGWDLGVVEAISSMAVVGFSVDFTVHLAQAYIDCPIDSRVARTEYALNHIGISVVSGAISTLLAGMMLFFCKVTYFVKYGSIIFTIILTSLLMSLTFFPAICAIIGPEGAKGDLRPYVSVVWARLRNKISPKNAALPE